MLGCGHSHDIMWRYCKFRNSFCVGFIEQEPYSKADLKCLKGEIIFLFPSPVAVAGACTVRQCQAGAWRVHLRHVDLWKVKHDAWKGGTDLTRWQPFRYLLNVTVDNKVDSSDFCQGLNEISEFFLIYAKVLL